MGDKGKIMAMGLVLGLLLFAFFLPTGQEERLNQPIGPTILRDVFAPETVAALRPDPNILSRIEDGTATQRAIIEPEPLAHLLRLSLNVSPDLALALGMPDQPLDVAALQRAPASQRGAYLWCKGILEQHSQSGANHPVQGYQVYQGRLRTADGALVSFYHSLANDSAPQVGEWVRMEGYFMKLHDDFLPEEVKEAPVLVGPRLYAAQPDWPAVLQLDPSILGQVRPGHIEVVPGTLSERKYVDTADMATTLPDGQNEALWHLASYAVNHKRQQEEPLPDVFTLEPQYREIAEGRSLQGHPMRIIGLFMKGRVYRAEVNPLGIKHWSEVWIRLPRLGKLVVPLWIPEDVGDWQRLQTVETTGYFFKNLRFTNLEEPPEVTQAPLFVAANMRRHVIHQHPFTKYVGIGFAAGITLLVGLFFMMARQSSRQSKQHDEELVQRRRRRRKQQSGASFSGGVPD